MEKILLAVGWRPPCSSLLSPGTEYRFKLRADPSTHRQRHALQRCATSPLADYCYPQALRLRLRLRLRLLSAVVMCS